MTAQTTQVYSIFIRATPEQVWEAITTPEFSHKYFHGARLTCTPDAHISVDDDGAESRHRLGARVRPAAAARPRRGARCTTPSSRRRREPA